MGTESDFRDSTDRELATLYLAESMCGQLWENLNKLRIASADRWRYDGALAKVLAARDDLDERRGEYLEERRGY